MAGNIVKEAGPVSMTFTIPMYNVSRLQACYLNRIKSSPYDHLFWCLHLPFFYAQVKYLQIAKKSNTYNPYRWVRYVTQANSYVARL